jgi:glycosyltransferase involved in cell wall biosynthesis
MTVAIDMIGTKLGSGTKTYNLNFCKTINKKELKEKLFIFITKDYLDNLSLNENKNIKYIVKSKILGNIFFRVIWMQFFLPFELKRLNVVHLYSPMNMAPIFLRFFKIKLTLALHSNLPWVYFSKMPGNFIRNILTKYLMEISVYASDVLIVDSEFAKIEIVKLLNIKKKEIFVVYLGIDGKYLDSVNNNNFIDDFIYQNYIISVASCVKYHNIINLLRAYKLLKEKYNFDLKFVLVLQILDKNYYSEIKDFISKNFKIGQIFLFHNLDSNYLPNLYRNANFYVFSSYCEVFGLTSLEAMSQGCPVLISHKSALPEINKDAAEYFDPDDIDQIAAGMNKILCNDNIKKNLIKKGNEHFKNFNWFHTVNETIKVLDI